MTVANTGTMETSGTAVILVQNSDEETIKEYRRDLPVTAMSDSTTINKTWESAGATASSYSITGYTHYGGQTTDPQ
jgi:hypothetical protein